jgi:hypothetical protein
MVSIQELTTFGPPAGIPISRAQNVLRFTGMARRTAGFQALLLCFKSLPALRDHQDGDPGESR